MNFYRSCIASASDFAPSYSAQVNGNIFQTSFENACAGKTDFNSAVVVGNNVINCINAFAGCTNLNQSVRFENSASDIKCRNMFRGCTKLNSAVTGSRPISMADNMFAGCSSLVGNINLQNVSDGENMFSGCASLAENINIGFLSTNKIGNIFNGCVSLNHDIVLNGVTDYDGSMMFANHQGLNRNIMINNATNCYMMFYGCSKLVGNVSVGNAYSKNCQSMFYGCSNLSSASVENISNQVSMFFGCANLATVNMNGGVNDWSDTFHGCRSLNYNIDLSGGTNFVNTFRNCTSLNQHIVVPRSFNESCNAMFDGCTSIREVTLNFLLNKFTCIGLFNNRKVTTPLKIYTRESYNNDVVNTSLNMLFGYNSGHTTSVFNSSGIRHIVCNDWINVYNHDLGRYDIEIICNILS